MELSSRQYGCMCHVCTAPQICSPCPSYSKTRLHNSISFSSALLELLSKSSATVLQLVDELLLRHLHCLLNSLDRDRGLEGGVAPRTPHDSTGQAELTAGAGTVLVTPEAAKVTRIRAACVTAGERTA